MSQGITSYQGTLSSSIRVELTAHTSSRGEQPHGLDGKCIVDWNHLVDGRFYMWTLNFYRDMDQVTPAGTHYSHGTTNKTAS